VIPARGNRSGCPQHACIGTAPLLQQRACTATLASAAKLAQDALMTRLPNRFRPVLHRAYRLATAAIAEMAR